MTERMPKLDRLLSLVHALSDTTEGLTLDEMAGRLGVNRRTAERMRDVIALHFDLDELPDDRRKRFLIRGSLRRAFTKPTAAEIAGLEAEVDARRKGGQQVRAGHLEGLLRKVKAGLDDREKRRIAPDLEPLVRLQRSIVPAGPAAVVAPATLASVQEAMCSGLCLEFDYATEDGPAPRWRRVIPYGLVHGPLTYLLGKMPGRDEPPVYYRLDRMTDTRLSDLTGVAPDDWDLDRWLAESFAVWRDEKQEVVLRVSPSASSRARTWRFHPGQTVEELADGGIRIRFVSGGMRELAEHLFSWGGDLVIERPAVLIDILRERIGDALSMLPPTPPDRATTDRVAPVADQVARAG